VKLLERRRASKGAATAAVSIRPRGSWYLRTALQVVAVVGIVGGMWGFFHLRNAADRYGRVTAQHQLERALEEKTSLEQGLAQARTALAERERQAKIDAAAQADLTRSVAQLQEENAKLKEDLELFRTIMAGGNAPRSEGLAVGAFHVEPDGAPDSYRFRAMLSYRHKRDEEFHGRAAMLVHLMQNGRQTTLTLPEEGNSPGDLANELRFKYYQKLEGTFKVAAGTRVRSVELRVFEQGRSDPVATRSAGVS
jgi:hypothetical protein